MISQYTYSAIMNNWTLRRLVLPTTMLLSHIAKAISSVTLTVAETLYPCCSDTKETGYKTATATAGGRQSKQNHEDIQDYRCLDQKTVHTPSSPSTAAKASPGLSYFSNRTYSQVCRAPSAPLAVTQGLDGCGNSSSELTPPPEPSGPSQTQPLDSDSVGSLTISNSLRPSQSPRKSNVSGGETSICTNGITHSNDQSHGKSPNRELSNRKSTECPMPAEGFWESLVDDLPEVKHFDHPKNCKRDRRISCKHRRQKRSNPLTSTSRTSSKDAGAEVDPARSSHLANQNATPMAYGRRRNVHTEGKATRSKYSNSRPDSNGRPSCLREIGKVVRGVSGRGRPKPPYKINTAVPSAYLRGISTFSKSRFPRCANR